MLPILEYDLYKYLALAVMLLAILFAYRKGRDAVSASSWSLEVSPRRSLIAAKMIFRCPSETPSSRRSASVICESARRSTSFWTNASMYLLRPSWLSQSSIVCIERFDPRHSCETSANIVVAPHCKLEDQASFDRDWFIAQRRLGRRPVVFCPQNGRAGHAVPIPTYVDGGPNRQPEDRTYLRERVGTG